MLDYPNRVSSCAIRSKLGKITTATLNSAHLLRMVENGHLERTLKQLCFKRQYFRSIIYQSTIPDRDEPTNTNDILLLFGK